MTSSFEPVIGLEVHARLRTRTKMFCACRNAYGAAPNTLTCPVCLGSPGALPVPNRRAFELALRVGLALDAVIAGHTTFDRKQYFYPDQPKGYQITQFERPLIRDGALPLPGGRRIPVPRAHLEEDAGKSVHDARDDASLVDLNRAGVPLLEIVSAPALATPAEAVEWLERLRLLLRHLEASDGDMEKGSLRCDVNVSLRRRGHAALGTRVEIKNLNSFRAVRASLDREIVRQAEVLHGGGHVAPETRHWDEAAGTTRPLRSKEESRDYRYLPDPDLPPVTVAAAWIEATRAALPELPWVRARRWCEAWRLEPDEAALLVQDPGLAGWFEAVVEAGAPPPEAARWIVGEVFALVRSEARSLLEGALEPGGLARVIARVAEGAVTAATGREVVGILFRDGGDPDAVIAARGLGRVADAETLSDLLDAAVQALPRAARELAAGKAKARGALIGHVMKATGGRADPAALNALIDARYPR